MTRVVALVAAAGLVLAATACGSTAPRGGASGAVAFSGCMRSNGVSGFPDPASSGTIPKKSMQQLGVSSSVFQAAQRACRHLLPNGGRPPDQAARQRIREQGLRFARCVRAHGVPGFPDPGSDGRIPDPATVGIDQGAPAFRAANTACAKDRPPYLPSNAAYDAWARTHAGGAGS